MTERNLLDAAPTSPSSNEGTGFELPALGAVVGDRYRIVRQIGAGGMGVVFEAKSSSVGRRFAIKFLRSERASQSRSSLRFEREARLLARLEHDHLTAVLDLDRFGGTPYYVMEYLDGETLRRTLQREGSLPVHAALELMRQTCRGMAHAHDQGVVHRDLKPDNLMLVQRSDGQRWVKILDFGIARFRDAGEVALTPSGAELGTPHYMSPEQARGAKQVDARTDVFALGAILYEMLCGQRAYAGASYNEVLFRLLTQRHRPLAEVLPACPDDVVLLVERCLSKNAAERYRDARELLEAVSRCLGGTAGANAVDASPAPVAPAAGERRTPGRAWGRGGWMSFTGGALFAAASAMLLWPLRDAPPNAPAADTQPEPLPRSASPLRLELPASARLSAAGGESGGESAVHQPEPEPRRELEMAAPAGVSVTARSVAASDAVAAAKAATPDTRHPIDEAAKLPKVAPKPSAPGLDADDPFKRSRPGPFPQPPPVAETPGPGAVNSPPAGNADEVPFLTHNPYED